MHRALCTPARVVPLLWASCLAISLCHLVAGLTRSPDVRPAKQELDQPTLAWMQTVLNNWERACRHDLHVSTEPLPWIIFYDQDQAYHLMPEVGRLPPHELTPVSLRFAGRTFRLTRVAHQRGRLWVPDREAIDIATPKAAAMPYHNDQRSFFIAPLPALYRRLAGAEQASDLDELFLGLTAHESTHTRQLAYAARRIERLRARYKLPESLDDNTIERELRTNDEYKSLYNEERKLISAAIMTGDLADCRRRVADILESARVRRARFFVGDKAGYSDLEDTFLAMEGMAMWVQYRTARQRAPAREEWLTTLVRLSERTDAWSQEEGLGLFLLIDRLVPGWQKLFLKPAFPSPFAVLRAAVSGRRQRRSATT